jgi:hypothetical protein
MEATMTSHRRSSQLQRSLAAGLVAAALAAPAAQAAPILEPGSGDAPLSMGPDTRGLEPDPVPADATTIDEGLDWGSAAIGAGGAGMLILLALAGSAQVNRRRTPVSRS